MAIDVVILGAGHPATEAILDLLGDRNFPVGELSLLDDEEHAAQRVEFKEQALRIKNIDKYSFGKGAIVFNLHDDAQFVQAALDSESYVIDFQGLLSSTPRVVAGLASAESMLTEDIHYYVMPDALSVALAISIDKVNQAEPVKKLVISTYQAVSSEPDGITELATQTANLLNIKPVSPEAFAKQIAFNVIPQIGSIQDTGITDYEMKVTQEIQDVFNQTFEISLTCVSVPVFYGYAASVYLETENTVDIQQLENSFQADSGLEYLSGRDEEGVATPVTEAAGQPELFVSRLRQDISGKAAITYWLVSDNIRHGMALNAVKVAEELLEFLTQ